MGWFESLPGGVGLLGVGPLTAAALALLLAWRHRLVLALATGSLAFLLAAFVLQYEPARDVARLDGHARNLALLALLLAVSVRVAGLRPRWRHAAAALFFVLITWPTTASPIAKLGLALSHGPRFDNAQRGQPFHSNFMSRYTIETSVSEATAAWIRQHTDIDARILSPDPIGLSVATGRPNAAGYSQFSHYSFEPGPEYSDAIRYLEPAALRRRGFAYIHATDAWIARLPDRAQHWLTDARYFEPLVRDGADALYRIQPAFLRLESAPAPPSFEALRRAVPEAAAVYLSPDIPPLDSIRIASALSHARIFGGARHRAALHMYMDTPPQPLGHSMPDFAATSARLAPSALTPAARQPIWWTPEVAVYALQGGVAPLLTPPPPFLSVRISQVRADAGRLGFLVTFTDHGGSPWKGQDWLVSAADDSPWAFPSQLERDRQRHAGSQWYAGQIVPGQGTTERAYQFDPRAATLATGDDDGRFTPAASSGTGLSPGVWTLAVRLRGDWWEVAFIPVMKIVVTEHDEVRYEVYEGDLDARLPP